MRFGSCECARICPSFCPHGRRTGFAAWDEGGHLEAVSHADCYLRFSKGSCTVIGPFVDSRSIPELRLDAFAVNGLGWFF